MYCKKYLHLCQHKYILEAIKVSQYRALDNVFYLHRNLKTDYLLQRHNPDQNHGSSFYCASSCISADKHPVSRLLTEEYQEVIKGIVSSKIQKWDIAPLIPDPS